MILVACPRQITIDTLRFNWPGDPPAGAQPTRRRTMVIWCDREAGAGKCLIAKATL